MRVAHVTGTMNHLVIEDMAVAMREAGISCALVSPRAERLLGRTFVRGDHVIVPELESEGLAQDPARAAHALHSALSHLEPDLVVLHDISHVPLLSQLEEFRTALVVHTVLCSGQKLFRRTNEVCRHPVGYRCLIDWYRGPCGSTPDPRVAIRQARSASSYQRALEAADEIWVLSRFMARYLADESPNATAIRILDPRFGLPSIPTASAGLPPPERSGLVFAGRLTYGKGLLSLLDAMALVPEIELRMFGEGYLRTEVARRAEQLPNVSLWPFLDRDELPAAYASARAVIVPSLGPESLGMVPFEALRCGTPVIVSDRGGLPEWGEFFDSGLTVLDDVSAPMLAAELRRAITHPPAVVPSGSRSTDRLTVVQATEALCR